MAQVERRAGRFVRTLMGEEPAILAEGPGGSGKFDAAAVHHRVSGRSVVLDLDDPATARLLAEDP